MSQQKRRFEASAKHCRLFKKQKPLAPRNGSGGPYAQTTAAPALRSPNRILFRFPLNQGAAKRALLARTFFRLLFSSCGGRGMNEKRD
jgi:hypothetical protein